MWKDPIVEEIHAVREEIARRFNYDLGEIIADIRKRQEANPGRVVRKEDLARRRAGLEGQNVEREDGASPEPLSANSSAS
jgi:hypothetical protein